MIARKHLVLVVIVCAGAGCLFPSLSDLTGGDGAPPIDAGDASDANASDAPPTGTFCSTQDATFCEDFDEPDGGYVSRWTSLQIGAGNTVMTESDASSSAPNALVVGVPLGASGGAALLEDLPPSVTTYEYAFAIRFEPYDAGAGSVYFNQIEVDNPSAYTEYRFQTLAGATHFQAHVFYADGGNTLADLPMSITFMPGQWYRVVEQLTVSSPAKVTILVNGSPALSTTIAEATNGIGTSEFLAGIYHTNAPTGAWFMEIDDVVMHTQ
jgi:hypothetical protein